MRYNIICWDLTADPHPELICDTWENTEHNSHAILRQHQSESYHNRVIIIDWGTTKVIAELQYGKIKEVQPPIQTRFIYRYPLKRIIGHFKRNYALIIVITLITIPIIALILFP
ncbi:MAG: hypothetical protein Q7R56_01775 [Nanoarchaeota archaeon]|nr:hypothetical protein [Nanoarchaeota archaeon]